MGRVGEYEVLETLGRGAYSVVKKVVHTPTGSISVAKIIPKTNRSVENNVRQEISILRRLKHRNIVQLVEILESSSNYYIILEPVMGGDVCDLITSEPGPLSEQDVAALFIQLVAGVRACHRHGVAHRDLKPENLLLGTDCVLKISDFGSSRFHRESNFQASISEYAHTLTGTLPYVAPEVFAGGYDAFKADIWSMGCILYVLLTQNFPFGSACDPSALEDRIRKGQVCSMPATVSSEARNLCSWLLSLRPEDRPSLDDVARHQFFVQNLPSDYIAVTDPCRSQLVQGANAEELSSTVHEGHNNKNTILNYTALGPSYKGNATWSIQGSDLNSMPPTKQVSELSSKRNLTGLSARDLHNRDEEINSDIHPETEGLHSARSAPFYYTRSSEAPMSTARSALSYIPLHEAAQRKSAPSCAFAERCSQPFVK